jgi:hypothetical protein
MDNITNSSTNYNNNTLSSSSSTAGIGMAALGLSIFFGLLCAIAWICLMLRNPETRAIIIKPPPSSSRTIRRKDTQKERLVPHNAVDSEQQHQSNSTNPFSLDEENTEIFATIDLNTLKISDPVLDKPPKPDEEIVQSELDSQPIVPNKLS